MAKNKLEENTHVADTLVAMADVASKAGYCGAWYPMANAEVGAVCMRKASAPGKLCGECDRLQEELNETGETFKLVRGRRRY